ncbi:MAG: DUF4271 domain-containing protein [Dysgonamonadaceae bacterium]|jgi:hypothetical protein|nr:DUF4271 domain-containing protein [Dysgonamonadaceae bacterium]
MRNLFIFLDFIFTEEPLSVRVHFHNWGFILFLICFFIFIHAFSTGPKLLYSMVKGLSGSNNRESIFAEQINNEFIIKVLLCLQTIILCSVNLFSYHIYQADISQEHSFQMFPFILKSSALILSFFLYKALVYSIAGNIFFTKESLREWNDYNFSIICISGFILFLPTLLLFYIEKIVSICFFFYVIYFILVIILVSRKIYVLFFPHKTLLLHFILYLCAQEIVPLYFLYKGLSVLFIE